MTKKKPLPKKGMEPYPLAKKTRKKKPKVKHRTQDPLTTKKGKSSRHDHVWPYDCD